MPFLSGAIAAIIGLFATVFLEIKFFSRKDAGIPAIVEKFVSYYLSDDRSWFRFYFAWDKLDFTGATEEIEQLDLSTSEWEKEFGYKANHGNILRDVRSNPLTKRIERLIHNVFEEGEK